MITTKEKVLYLFIFSSFDKIEMSASDNSFYSMDIFQTKYFKLNKVGNPTYLFIYTRAHITPYQLV